MKHMKKLLALLLCLAMALSILPMSVLAAESADPVGATIGRPPEAEAPDALPLAPADPASVVASGTCGDDLTWTLTDGGVLSITGTGAMYNYGTGADSHAPWYDNRDAITSVSIGAGVTSIGSYAFYDCAAVTGFSVAGGNFWFRSVDGVLYDHACTVLYVYPGGRAVNFFTAPASVRVVEVNAFSTAVNLLSVTLPAVTELRENAFHNSGVRKVYCPKLQTIGAGAFSSCHDLLEFTFGPQVESIGMAAFLGCTGVEKLTFMGSAPTVGTRAFPTTLSADAYYPADDDTWTAEFRQSCGGNLNWIEYDSLPDGYYLIGPDGWTLDAVDPNDLLVLNSAQGNNDSSVDEYMLTATLTAGDPIKVVKVFSGAITDWYPSGTGNEYTVDSDHSGNVTIYFRARYNSAWSDFGGYIWIEAAPETKYGLRVNGEEVTEDHLTDTAYNCWTFDGDHTLTILKDIKGDCDYLDDVGFFGPNVIENYGLEGLVIDFAQHARLTASDKASSTWPSAIYAMKDTVITGAGGGECVSVWEDAIGVRYGATLTIRDTDLQVRNEDYDGILGGNLGAAKSRMVVDHARLDVTANTGYSAISGFGGGIELIGCEIVEPAGGRISDDGASIVNADGSKAAHVVIEPIAVKYGLRIDGVEVTEDNKDDVLGNGIFSFDGEQTLTVTGDYSSSVPADQLLPVIENYGMDDLIVDLQGELTGYLILDRNTTICGTGSLVLPADKGAVFGICCRSLTVKDVTLDIHAAGTALWGWYNDSALVLDNVTATLESGSANGRPLPAVSDFSGGITLKKCSVVEPAGAKVDEDGSGMICDAEGKSVNLVKISRWENPFVDVKAGKYYYEPVLWAFYHTPYQITKGTDETHFSPNQTCTRAQVVSFLWNAMGKPEPSSTDNPFVDVKESKYYYKAVLWAVEQGVTKGADDTHFNPNGKCTRAQVVTFLWNAAGKPEPSGTDNPFVDVKESKYYYKPVLWAVENGITKGTDETHFSPNQTCTRGQVVTFLYNALGK